MSCKKVIVYVHGYGGNGQESPILEKLNSILSPAKHVLLPFLWQSGGIGPAVYSDLKDVASEFATDTFKRAVMNSLRKLFKSKVKSDFLLSQARSCLLGGVFEKFLKREIDNVTSVSIVSFSLGTRIVHDFLKLCTDLELLSKINKIIMLAPAMPNNLKANLASIRIIKPDFKIEAYYSHNFDLALKVAYPIAGNALRAAGEVGFSDESIYKNVNVNLGHGEYEKLIDFIDIE